MCLLEKQSISQIAKSLSRSKSTISREIKRNSLVDRYDPKIAQEKSKIRRWHNYLFRWFKYWEFSKIFKSNFDKRYSGIWVTYTKIKQMKLEIKIPSLRHVYNLINSCNWVIHRQDRLKPRYIKRYGIRRRQKIRVSNKYVLPIALRPKCINQRLRNTDYELDLVCGTVKEKGSGNLVVLTNRATRQIYQTYSSSKNAFKVLAAVRKIILDNNLIIDSITPDRGPEFERLGILGKWFGITIYQCDAYKSWQKGSVENANGLIRRFFPSTTNFSKTDNQKIQWAINKINNMPRKMFNGLSANSYSKKNFN